MDFADRLYFSAGRSARVALRRGVARLAFRARLARFTCAAPAVATATQHRLLVTGPGDWTGGTRSLAASAGLGRIEPGCNSLSLPTCTAPAPIAGAAIYLIAA